MGFYSWGIHEYAGDWLIVPGVRAGEMTKKTSQRDLIEIYGKENVRESDIGLGEGFTEPGTIVFPDEPVKTIRILWEDTLRSTIREIRISGEKSLWKTEKGITIGTSLKTIEEINKKPFILAGFGWDYEGTILHCNGGTLNELGTETEQGIQSRTMILRLRPDSISQQVGIYESVLGDREFPSDNPAMQKLNPTVYEMIIYF
jgi:hypothetical protein